MEVSRLQYDLFRVLAPVVVGALTLLLIGSAQAERRKRPEVKVFILFVIATIGYNATNFMEMISRTEGSTLLWSQLIYAFIAFIPVIWIDFCLRFTREGRGLGAPHLIALLLVPIATFVILFVPGLRPLMWSRIEYFAQGDFLISRRGHGPWFAAYAIYTYASVVIGAAVVVRRFPRQRSVYRRQAAMILAGLLLPLAASLAYVLKLVPGVVKDFTPFGYAGSVFIFYFALFRMDLFSLVPIGRAAVVERLGIGILVLDREWRLADANPVAMKILGMGEEHIGKKVAETGSGADILPRTIVEAVRANAPMELRTESGGAARFYRVDAVQLEGSGSLAVLTEETELRGLLSKVEELARTDELTGLPNRRSFMSEAGRELARALRRDISLAAAMIDLDRFKEVNDKLGHGSGDIVLRRFGAILAEEARADDVYGRVGGDEFAVIAAGGPGASGVRFLCERLKKRLAAADLRDESGASLRVTMSVGIAALDRSVPTLEKLLANADSALYSAKSGGRDAIVIFGE
jgi:diguanylate cyclase (GGDEF)-like protein